MAKPQVIDLNTQARVPFLRGILTRSLQDAGLPFDEAYRLASDVRQELSHASTVTTDQLREAVLQHLHRRYGPGIAERYLEPATAAATVMVRTASGQTTPFSRGQHRRTLECCGLKRSDAAALTTSLYDHLVTKGTREITTSRLGKLTYRYLQRAFGSESSLRYLVWMDFLHSERPLLLLIGGTAGSGKSTIATKLAQRIEKARLQSTDMLREVMRMLIPERLLPVLHTSSFNARQALPAWRKDAMNDNELLTEGYCTQAELVAVACEAVIMRALKERVSLILEGVHIQPAFLQRIPRNRDAVLVPVMLAILKPAQLGKLIQVRGKRVPDRRSERYLEHFDAIWDLQTFLLSEADRAGIPIVANDNEEKAIGQIMTLVIEALSRDFSATPREVFM
jgi:2-phosphoglycerate kinase